MVLLVPADGDGSDDRVRRDQSDSDGTFTLQNIIPGRYVAMAIADGWDLEWSKPEELKPYRDKSQAVQIGADERQKISLLVLGAVN